MAPDDLVVMGRASGAFGLRGELKAYLFTDDPGLFARAGGFFIGPNPEHTTRLTLKGMRKQGKRLLLTTDQINSKEEADKLKGNWLYLKKSDLPGLDEDEYYWFELKGARVVTKGGEPLGTVTSLMDIGPHDVLVVGDKTGREVLIPVIAPVVIELDPAKGLVVVDPPEGLIEAQESQGAKGPSKSAGRPGKPRGEKGPRDEKGPRGEKRPRGDKGQAKR